MRTVLLVLIDLLSSIRLTVKTILFTVIHMLRHIFASTFVRNNIDLKTAQKLMRYGENVASSKVNKRLLQNILI